MSLGKKSSWAGWSRIRKEREWPVRAGHKYAKWWKGKAKGSEVLGGAGGKTGPAKATAKACRVIVFLQIEPHGRGPEEEAQLATVLSNR